MFGLRRRAKAEREKAISEERLYTLVNHALLRTFGPYGSYSITLRTSQDTDDIFHTTLAESIAKTVTKEIADSNLVLVAAPVSLAPAPVVPVKMSLAEAVSAAISPAFGPQIALPASSASEGQTPASTPAEEVHEHDSSQALVA